MSSALSQFILPNILLVAQVLSSVAVPAFGQCAFGQCATGQCCCSSEATQVGACCGGETVSGDCCCSAESSSSGQSHICRCGCGNDSRPTAPASPPENAREHVLKILEQSVAEDGTCLLAVNTSTALDSNRQPNAFYAGVSQQPLFCAWLL